MRFTRHGLYIYLKRFTVALCWCKRWAMDWTSDYAIAGSWSYCLHIGPFFMELLDWKGVTERDSDMAWDVHKSLLQEVSNDP